MSKPPGARQQTKSISPAPSPVVANVSGPAQPAPARLNAGLAAARFLGNEFFQARLKIGAENDRYEREADRVADHVLGMALPGAPPDEVSPAASSIQRKCSGCAAEDELLQLKANPSGAPAGPMNAAGLGRLGGGMPLSTAARSYFEPRFGVDFSGVRVHTGSDAHAVSAGVNARAFTYGGNIVFAAGEYRPDSAGGRRLLAHELTHVVQQSGGRRQISRAVDKTGRKGLLPRISGIASHYVQRITGTCRRLLGSGGFLSSIAIGNAVEDEIQRDFERRLGPRRIFDVESGTSAPYGGSPTIAPPSIYGAARFGVGSPDIAYPSRTGAAMLVAEIKPANWGGLLLAESQLANYIVKGNAPENAALRASLGVRTITPMTGRGRFRTPRYVTALGERYRVVWCGPGVILYGPASKKKKKKKKKKKTSSKKKATKKTSKKKASKKVSKKKTGGRRATGRAGAFNFGLGISIGSFGVGAGNVGIGVSINSMGASVGTVSAGVAYNSMGAALGAVGAGASVDSESAGAGVAGAGLTDSSTSAAAGAAGAGRSSGNTVAGAGVAGTGTMTDTTGAAAGRTGSGTVEGGGSDGVRAPGAEGAEGGTGTEGSTEGGGVEGGAVAEGSTVPGTGGTVPGSTAGGGAGDGGVARIPGAAGAGTGGDRDRGATDGGAGTGAVASDPRLAEIVRQLQLESPHITDTGGLARAVADAARLDQLVQNATPAQRILLQTLARSTEEGTYYLPSPDWALMMLEATQGISEEDLEYLMRLDWDPANVTLEQLRQSIQRALAQRQADMPPPPPSTEPPPPSTTTTTTITDGTGGGTGTGTETPPPTTTTGTETGPAPEPERPPETGTGSGGTGTSKKKTKKKTKKKRTAARATETGEGARPSRFAGVSASSIAAALRSLDWSDVERGQALINFDRGIFYGRTEPGTRYGAFITLGELEHEGARITVINDSSDVVVIDTIPSSDDTSSADGISLWRAGGTQEFIFFGGVGGPTPAGSVVADGAVLLGLALNPP